MVAPRVSSTLGYPRLAALRRRDVYALLISTASGACLQSTTSLDATRATLVALRESAADVSGPRAEETLDLSGASGPLAGLVGGLLGAGVPLVEVVEALRMFEDQLKPLAATFDALRAGARPVRPKEKVIA